MWWQWVTPLRFSFKMADLLPGKIPVAHSARVYACAWAWCICVFFFSLMFIKTSKLCIRVYRFLHKSSPKLSNSLSHWNSRTCGICTPTGCTPNSAVEPLLKYVHKSDGRISISPACLCWACVLRVSSSVNLVMSSSSFSTDVMSALRSYFFFVTSVVGVYIYVCQWLELRDYSVWICLGERTFLSVTFYSCYHLKC